MATRTGKRLLRALPSWANLISWTDRPFRERKELGLMIVPDKGKEHVAPRRFPIRFAFFGVFLAPCLCFAELTAPVPITPGNGALLQLTPGTDTLLLQWSEVADATGYLLTVTGPQDFGTLENLPVEPTPGTVAFTLNGVLPGDYVWRVGSVAGTTIVSGTPFFFTIQSPPPGGGELPAPDPLQPRDFAFFHGTTGRVTFQWTRVAGAQSYRLTLRGMDSAVSFFPVEPVSEEGQIISQTYQIISGNKTRIYTWTVAAIDETGVGSPSRERTFAFTAENASPRRIPFLANRSWMEVNSFLDVTGDAVTNAADILPLLQFWHDGRPRTVDSPGPTLLSPAENSIIAQTDVTFVWNTVPGARSYELVVETDADEAVTTQLVPQSSGTTSSASVGFLALGGYRWKVRALFGSGENATQFSGPMVFSATSENPAPNRIGN